MNRWERIRGHYRLVSRLAIIHNSRLFLIIYKMKEVKSHVGLRLIMISDL